MIEGASLRIAPLERAFGSLQEGLAARADAPTDKLIRDAVIQRFEYTYELAWKIMKRFLETEHGEQDADQWSRRDLYRIAAEVGLITAPAEWFTFMTMRNLSSHTYNEDTANAVASVVPTFATHCADLIAELHRRLKDAASD